MTNSAKRRLWLAALLLGGCTTFFIGLDLSLRGVLSVLTDLELSGAGPDGDDANTEPDPVAVSLVKLPDSGSARVGAADLTSFLSET